MHDLVVRKVLLILLKISAFLLPIFIPSWHGKILAVCGIVWIFSGFGVKIVNEFKENFVLLIALTITSLYVLGLLSSINLTQGFASLETIMPLLLLPLLIYTSEVVLSLNPVRNILICFTAGVITLNLASLAFISKDLWDPVNLQSNIVFANNNIVKIHPAYSSLYLSFSIFFLIDQFFPLQLENRKKLGWVLFALFILIGYLIWINSRTGILSFCVAFVFYSFYRFKGRTRMISLSIFAIIAIMIFSIPFSKERFINAPRLVLFNGALAESSDPNVYPLIVRKNILQCSIDLVKWPEVIFGYGTGDFRDVLNESLRRNGYNSLSEKSLDQHNEYFAQMHRHGIIGLSLFISLLIIPFLYALKYRSPLLAVFIILFALTALFENVFSAQKGVTFFALFCPLLMLYARKSYMGNGEGPIETPLESIST